MTSGYWCTNCKQPFKGEPPLELVGTLRGQLDKYFKGDGGTGEYCVDCGKKIFAGIKWDK